MIRSLRSFGLGRSRVAWLTFAMNWRRGVDGTLYSNSLQQMTIGNLVPQTANKTLLPQEASCRIAGPLPDYPKAEQKPERAAFAYANVTLSTAE